jgi:hypothetical protein
MIQDKPNATPSGNEQPFGMPDTRPGLLVIGGAVAGPDMRDLADCAGLRLLDHVPLGGAVARMDRQIGGDVALLFCASDDVVTERLLIQLETLSAQAQMRLIVVADRAALELAYALIRLDRTILLCDPAPADLAVALVTAASRAGPVRTLHDFGRDDDTLRFQELSDEVARLARTVEALTRVPMHAPPAFPSGPRMHDRSNDYVGMPALAPLGAPASASGGLDATTVRDLLRARRMRADFMPEDLFADPAWDMLLDLLAARLDHERVSVSSLCIASAVPPTTALRWIRTLTDRGLLVRQADPQDGRRVFIALSDDAANALIQWFAASRRYWSRQHSA